MKIKSKSAGNKSVLHIIDELLTDAGLSGFWDGWDHGTLSRAAEVVDEVEFVLCSFTDCLNLAKRTVESLPGRPCYAKCRGHSYATVC